LRPRVRRVSPFGRFAGGESRGDFGNFPTKTREQIGRNFARERHERRAVGVASTPARRHADVGVPELRGDVAELHSEEVGSQTR